MKRKLVYLLLLPLLFACSGDNYEDLKSHPIVGTWELTDLSYSSEVDQGFIEEKINESINKEREKVLRSNLELTLDDDGNFTTRSNGDFIGQGRYKIKKNQLIMSDSRTKLTSEFSLYFDELYIDEDQTAYYKKSVSTMSDGADWSKSIHKVVITQSYKKKR